MLIGEFLALSVAIFWAITVVMFTDASNKIGALQVNINRIIIAAFFYLLYIYSTGQTLIIKNEQVLLLGVSGIIGLVLGDTFLFKAFVTIGPALSMLIMCLSPIITTILGIIFLGEYLSILTFLGILITILGILLVVYKHNENDNVKFKITFKGLVYAVLAALGQSAGFILSKEALNIGEIDGFVAAFYRIAISGITFLALGIVTKRYQNPVKLFLSNKKAFILIVIGSFTGPFMGIALSLLSIKYTSVGVSSTIMSIVPILMLPVQKFYYKEHLTKKAIIGAFIAVFGTIILFIK